MATMTWEEALRHVGSLMPAEVERRAQEAIPHYIWTMKRRKLDMETVLEDRPPKAVKQGFCTNCLQWHELTNVPVWAANDPYKDDFEMDEACNGGFELESEFAEWKKHDKKITGRSTHGDLGYCPYCGAKAQYRSLNIGYKTLHDRILLVIYRKSAVEANAVVCVGYDVIVAWKDMDPDESLEPPMNIKPAEVCVFRYGQSADRFLFKRYEMWRGGQCEARWTDWHHMGKCTGGWQPGAEMFGRTNVRTVLDKTSLLDAVQGTDFGHVISDCPVNYTDSWRYFDKITVMARLAKYPCIEYLYRLGYAELAKYVIDEPAGKLLNLRGKTAKSVLRLTNDQWGEIKGKKLAVTPRVLETIRFMNANRIRMNMDTCAWLGSRYDNELWSLKELYAEHPGLPVARIVKYCRKKRVLLHDYRDYVGQMAELRMNLQDRNELFPRDFDEMHGRLSERTKIKESKATDRKIRERLSELSAFCFSAYGFVLRPMLSAGEVVREGTALHHCVGGYVNRYADGKTILCCLRAEEALAKPRYTVEMEKDGRMVQCRGDHNRTAPEDEETLERFWTLYKAMRADLTAQEKREARKARYTPAERKTA